MTSLSGGDGIVLVLLVSQDVEAIVVDTTPVRLVWNSSQKFRGLNLNDLLLKGPDVLHSIRSVLLKFRRGVFAALPFGLKTEKLICTGSWGGTMKNSWASMQSRESTLETSQQVVLLSSL